MISTNKLGSYITLILAFVAFLAGIFFKMNHKAGSNPTMATGLIAVLCAVLVIISVGLNVSDKKASMSKKDKISVVIVLAALISTLWIFMQRADIMSHLYIPLILGVIIVGLSSIQITFLED